MMATIQGSDAQAAGTMALGDVVEINLLLPTHRMEALIALARQRRQSVGQILRQWIDRGLTVDE